MIKLLIGGSPCTFWSIAQKNNRETEPSGMGWELFKNYLIAKEKFKPDFFLYENNKSAAQAIKDEIKKQFGVWDGTFLMEDSGARYIEINSALVSAQNRQRFYVHNCGDVVQPCDRGILLRDVLESGKGWTEKSYAVTTRDGGAIPEDTLKRKRHTMVAEPVIFQTPRGNNAGGCKYEKTPTLTANGSWQDNNKVIETVRIPEYGKNEKARALTAGYANKGCGEGTLLDKAFPENPNKQKVDFIAEPVPVNDIDGKSCTIRATCYKDGIRNLVGNDIDKRTCVAEPIRIGDMGSKAQAHRIYSIDGKSVCINSGGGGLGAKTGLYAIPNYHINDKNTENLECATFSPPHGYNKGLIQYDKFPTLTTGSQSRQQNVLIEKCQSNLQIDTPLSFINKVYEVLNGKITIKGKQYPIKLKDGFYIIRKLTVTECCRLQTMPDDYCRAVSNSQAYKGLGNGWTAEVIIHILSHALKNVPKDEKIVVLSMYDGIGTGRYCLNKMGFTNVEYHAYEIDKYAMQIAMSNYPDIIQHGDAFTVRNEDWKL